ncbi:MAG: fused MFS/spermidine synthase [Verrucomicrobiota bacterium]
MKNLAVIGFALCVVVIAVVLLPKRGPLNRKFADYGQIIHEVDSEFSRIRVRETEDGVRTLIFVDEDGRESRQSAINVHRPHELQLEYTKNIFASFLFQPRQERVLIVGLGGGGMVRFLHHVSPEMFIEAVEIDPAVVAVAAQYFGTQENDRLKIHVEDAFQFFRDSSHGLYDVIYMDAFLKPTINADAPQLAQRLKTADFLREIRARLEPNGVLAFNLIESDNSTETDLAAIGDVFENVYLFSVPATGNLVVIAAAHGSRLSQAELEDRASGLEAEFAGALPFKQFVEGLR